MDRLCAMEPVKLTTAVVRQVDVDKRQRAHATFAVDVRRVQRDNVMRRCSYNMSV